MGHTLEQFTSQCHQFLKNNPGPAGRQQVANLLKDVLLDKEFIEKYLHANVGEREIIYEDPELGFCVVAHNYPGAKNSTPHDHAHSWAIYGQARGETEMCDYELIEAATAERAPDQLRILRTQGDLAALLADRAKGARVVEPTGKALSRRSSGTRRASAASAFGPLSVSRAQPSD